MLAASSPPDEQRQQQHQPQVERHAQLQRRARPLQRAHRVAGRHVDRAHLRAGGDAAEGIKCSDAASLRHPSSSPPFMTSAQPSSACCAQMGRASRQAARQEAGARRLTMRQVARQARRSSRSTGPSVAPEGEKSSTVL